MTFAKRQCDTCFRILDNAIVLQPALSFLSTCRQVQFSQAKTTAFQTSVTLHLDRRWKPTISTNFLMRQDKSEKNNLEINSCVLACTFVRRANRQINHRIWLWIFSIVIGKSIRKYHYLEVSRIEDSITNTLPRCEAKPRTYLSVAGSESARPRVGRTDRDRFHNSTYVDDFTRWRVG